MTKRCSMTQRRATQLGFAFHDDAIRQDARGLGWYGDDMWRPGSCPMAEALAHFTQVKRGHAIWADGEARWGVGEIATRAILVHVASEAAARDVAEYAISLRDADNSMMPTPIEDIRRLVRRHAERLGVACVSPSTPAPTDERIASESIIDRAGAPLPLLDLSSLIAQPAVVRSAAVPAPSEDVADRAEGPASMSGPAPRMNLSAATDARVAPSAPSAPVFDPEASALVAPPSPPPPPAVVEAVPEVDIPTGHNYYLPDVRPLAATWRERARGNIAAIKLWKAIAAEGRVATPDEQEVLITYVGWGASDLANRMFPTAATGHRDDEWEALAAELRAVLTPEEYADASRSTQYAHYTPEVVIARVWQGIERLGFAGGAVLEPGVGTGLFIGMTPEHMRAGMRYTGVEYDRVTAGIATLLYPEAAILRADFARTALPPMYDLAVGNPPYSDVVVTSDPRYKTLRLRLHDYFFAKAVDTLRPGGLLAFVTSCGTLDKGNDTARQYLAARADLVAAIRLPRGVFAKTAGTDTAVDVVFLRKRGAGATPDSIPWANLVEIPALVAGSKTVEVNEYFDAHPEMVLGTHAVAIGPHGPAYTVDPAPGRDLDAALAEAIECLPRDIYTPPSPALVPAKPASSGMATVPTAATAPETGRCREGNYLVADDGALMQIVDGFAQPVRIKQKGRGEGMYRSHAQTVAALVPIRDAVRDILREQAAGGDGAEAQRRLHRAYDMFVLSHGPINLTVYPASSEAGEEADDADQKGSPRTPNLSPFLDDPDAYLVSSIEIYNEETGEARKGPIFSQRVVAPPSPPEIVSSHDALSVVLDERGRVDTARIAELMAWPEEAVVADLGDSIFLDPDTGRWETSDAYLSGAVRTKLQLAEAAARIDPRLRRNAEALARVQPPDLKPSDITARLGAPWVPTPVVETFAEEVLGGSTTIAHTAATGTWTVVGYSFRGSAAGTSEWGTERRHAGVLLEDALNARLPNIYDTIRNDDGSTREELNVEATEAAREKLAKIKSSFQDWIWRDADRAMGLVRLYNDGYNNLAPRHFDGSHLTLPGASLAFHLYEHQKRAIWRILTSGSTYLAHAVGAGKCQPLDAKVLTPTGWKRMGDIAVGDRLIAGDGSATLVTGIFPQGERDIFRVSFSDGSSTECCEEHLWLTQTYAERTATNNERKANKNWPSAKPQVRSLADIRATLRDPRLGGKNHSIPMVGPVAFDDRPVPVEPYLLGVLLGDGNFSNRSVTLTTADDEMLSRIEPLLPAGIAIKRRAREGRCPSYGLSSTIRRGRHIVNPLTSAIDDLGLRRTTAEAKFIPDDYLFNCVEKRLSLLQGLLDTDGACSKRGHSVYFYTVSPTLADGVVHLVQSLGGTVRRRLKHPRYTHDGERRMGKPCHVLCLSLPPTVAPFRLSQKGQLVRPKTSYKPTRYIVSVEPVGRKEARCISVAHPSHLYVTDDFVVTHNTLSVIAAIMEQKRLGLITKPIVVVPGHTLKQWAREWMALYPDANILVADEAQFHKSRRRRFLARAATGVWDGIVITHSANSFIPVPAWFEERMVDDQIAEFEALRAEVDPSDRVTRKQLERQLEGMRAKIDALQSRKDDLVDLAELGVDQIVVDECQEFRKLSYGTNMGSIKGIDAEGSQRSWDLYVKSRYVLAEKNPTRGLILSSGTPVTNTLGEVFTIQRYMQEGALRERDLHNFDAWAAMFGEVRAELELQPSGKYKSVARFAEFTNVPELIQMVRSFMDVLMPSDLRDVVAVPRVRGGRREIVRCPATDAFKAYQGRLAARITAIEGRTGKPRKGDDIILSVINDGRHAAIDLRLVEPDHPNEPGNKINACIDNIARIWEETADARYRRPDGALYETPGAAQMVFSDLGTPAAEAKRGFSPYHWIRDELVARGIPASHIAFMQNFKKSEQKVKLFEAVNAGVVRVLIGSTQTMGTGVNAQTRLRALHHIDCPWLPSDLEQREGRIIRQKNQHEEVEIYAYATLGSLDAAMWQTLERKAKFIEAVLKGDTSIRRVEDVGESQSNQFAMAKALASGDERLLTKAGLAGDLARLRRLKAAHFDDQVAIRGHLADAEVTIRQAARRITAIEADLARREETRGDKFHMEVAGATHDERRSAGAALIASVERHVGERYHGVARLGRVAGFDLYFRGGAGVTATRYGYELYLQRTDYEQPIDIRVDTGELGAIARLENALSGFDKNLAHYELVRAQAERRLADFHPRLGQPFEFDRELTEKEAELAALDAELTREECGDEASSAPDGGAVHTPTDPAGAGAGEGEVSTPNDDASEHQAA